MSVSVSVLEKYLTIFVLLSDGNGRVSGSDDKSVVVFHVAPVHSKVVRRIGSVDLESWLSA